MKKTMLTIMAIFLGVLVLFVVLIYKSTLDIGTLAFLFAIALYLILYFSIHVNGKNSRLVNMRGFSMSNSFNYNTELIVSDIIKLENQTGGIQNGSNVFRWTLFASATFYAGICVIYSFVI